MVCMCANIYTHIRKKHSLLSFAYFCVKKTLVYFLSKYNILLFNNTTIRQERHFMSLQKKLICEFYNTDISQDNAFIFELWSVNFEEKTKIELFKYQTFITKYHRLDYSGLNNRN